MQRWNTPVWPTLALCTLIFPTLACSGGGAGSEGSGYAVADESGTTPAVEAAPTRDAVESPSPDREDRVTAVESSATLEGVPDACSLLSEKDLGELLAVDPSEIDVRTVPGSDRWHSQCDWRVGSGLNVSRRLDLTVQAAYIRAEYEAGIAPLPFWSGGTDFTTDDYVRCITAIPDAELVEYDPKFGAGAYLIKIASLISLRVESNVALASVPEGRPDKLILKLSISGSDDWLEDARLQFVLDSASRALQKLESETG